MSDPSGLTSVLANDEQNTTLNCRVSRTLRNITLYACSSGRLKFRLANYARPI